ncbi:uncharacterized protein LOC106876750 [Octopus bimaculoides]|uniref:PID domain-containing protein n=1 Tax=Octopus bimaculoides TaxID=37653 RepID=A0A0L8IAQ9_OCTBM|nr:uncharacterized protein LOC106876750 [Octopus bimaculoides]|eukprot:XP_014780926.1 PREDICTED: uncharacterized protein LOC106876750 [Octopus bimaculoides]
MAVGGSNLDGFSREHRDLVEGIFEEDISVENLMSTSLSDNKPVDKTVTFTDLYDDVDSDVFTENGSTCQDSDSMASDKFNSDDNNSITNEYESSDKSNDAKSKVKSLDGSFKKMSFKMSSVAKKIRAPIDKLRNSAKNTTPPEPKKTSFTDLSSVKINKLPQLFVAKYLGKRKCSKLVGARVTKKHVDNMMKTILKNLDSSGNIELPLKYIIVSTKGLHFKEHPMNQVKGVDTLKDCSIESISYCVQDMKYWRVFSYILVKELSSRNSVAECHAFLCESPVSARKMVVSLAAAFKIRTEKLKKEGLENQQFCVELRTPSELKTSLSDDCDV